jgi:hypothetical protein
MMSLTQPETQALGAIADGLAGADPRLASMLTIFSRLAAGEEMPARQTTRVRRGRPAAPVRAAPGRTRAGAQPARNRAPGARGWAGTRPRWCCGPSSAPHCSPPRWPSPPAAARPAPGRWERRAPRPPSRSMPARADADALRAEISVRRHSWPARWSPGCGRSARGSGPLPYRLALPVCQQAGPGRPLGPGG